MGKGDKKTKKGKLSRASYGVTRPHKIKVSTAPKKKDAEKKAPTKKKEVVAKEETAAPKKKAAAKKTE